VKLAYFLQIKRPLVEMMMKALFHSSQ